MMTRKKTARLVCCQTMHRVRALARYKSTDLQADGKPAIRELMTSLHKKLMKHGLHQVIVRISPSYGHASNGAAEGYSSENAWFILHASNPAQITSRTTRFE